MSGGGRGREGEGEEEEGGGGREYINRKLPHVSCFQSALSACTNTGFVDELHVHIDCLVV